MSQQEKETKVISHYCHVIKEFLAALTGLSESLSVQHNLCALKESREPSFEQKRELGRNGALVGGVDSEILGFFFYMFCMPITTLPLLRS